MGIRLLQWFVPRIKERLLAILYAEVAVEAETDTTLRHVANLERLETQAQAYEAAGKRHLAEIIRDRAAMITPDSPGNSALNVIASVAREHDQLPTPALLGPDENGAHACGKLPAPPQPQRTPKRRGRPKKTSMPNDATQE